jgi:hypothetical protein
MSQQLNKPHCPYEELVSLYAVSALPAEDIATVEGHLSECSECQREVDSLHPVVESMVHWPTDVLRVPSSLWERLAERISAEAIDQPLLETAPNEYESEWEEPARGIHCKLLAADTERNRLSMLVRLAPGVHYPPHIHAEVEELHLLHGELWINDRKLCPGDYSRREAGTADAQVWSETGCTCLLITSSRDTII